MDSPLPFSLSSPSAARTVHLVFGPTGAGKTTWARRFAAEHGAVRFALDDWMHGLYAPDMASGGSSLPDMHWVMARVARCQALMWTTSERVLAAGVDVVVEAGLLRRADRERWERQVAQAGHVASPCFVDAPLGLRRQRVLQRNGERGATHSFDVSPAMFDAMEAVFEPPDGAERERSRVVVSADAA